jgi:hypothetical protein
MAILLVTDGHLPPHCNYERGSPRMTRVPNEVRQSSPTWRPGLGSCDGVLPPRQLRLRIRLQELTLPFETSGDLAEAAESSLGQFPADEYPHFGETITEHVTKPVYDFANEFEFRLDLILDGLERIRDTA